MSKIVEEFKDCLTKRQWLGYQFEMQGQDMLSLLRIHYQGNPRNPLEWLMNDALKTKEERRVDITAFYQENSYCIEMKFNNYTIYPCHFKNDILPRFLKSDKEHKSIWVLCVRDKNRISKQVLSLCEEYNIEVCQLSELPYVFGLEYPVLALSNVNINNKVCRCVDWESIIYLTMVRVWCWRVLAYLDHVGLG